MPGDPLLIPVPSAGRWFTRERTVRLADASPAGRLRLDATVRYLQDVADDDAFDAGLGRAASWVVRRTTIDVRRPVIFRERVELTTWCSGVGARWAERRTSLRGERGGHIEAVALWVHVDAATGRPAALPERFDDVYRSAHGGRRVLPRRQRRSAPDDGSTVERRPFPLRFADFDVVGHVNNAAYWEAVEEVLAARRDLRAPLRAELEHHRALERDALASLAVRQDANGFELWVLEEPAGAQPATVSAAARVVRRAEESASTV
jgi:acyl-ACP thioesterase